MAVTCGVPFDLCAVRVTALDDVGNPSGSGYVSNNQVSISVTPNVEDGPSFTVRNGCGCSIFRVKSANTFNFFDFAFVNATIEPELQAMLLGAELIMDTADAVGHHDLADVGNCPNVGNGEIALPVDVNFDRRRDVAQETAMSRDADGPVLRVVELRIA